MAEPSPEEMDKEDDWKIPAAETTEDDVVVAVEESKRNACNWELPRSGGSSSKEEPVMPVTPPVTPTMEHMRRKMPKNQKRMEELGSHKVNNKSGSERGVLKMHQTNERMILITLRMMTVTKQQPTTNLHSNSHQIWQLRKAGSICTWQ